MVSALFWGAVPLCLAVLPDLCRLLLPLLCFAASFVRCRAVLCWGACVASLCCALLLLLCWSVSCGAACGFSLFVAGSRGLLLFRGGALRRQALGASARDKDVPAHPFACYRLNADFQPREGV